MTKQIKPANWARRHNLCLSLAIGSLLVSAWTLVRFFTQAHHFDLYGQEALAGQWLHGLHSGSATGPTNYVWKMLLLYAPLSLLLGDARLKLIILTLLINIVMFVVLTLALRAIWRELLPGAKRADWRLNAAMLWFASMAGSIFWIQYANSRNLEVAGGVVLLWLGLRFVKSVSWLRALGLLGLCSWLFFADPLQLYMTAFPMLIFMSGRQLLINRQLRRLLPAASLLGIVLGGYIVAKLGLKLVEHTWHLQVLGGYGGLKPTLSPSALVHGSIEAVKQMAHLYTGGAGPHISKIREEANLLVVGAVLTSAGVAAIRKPKYRKLVSLVACVWAIDLIVYVVSSQAIQTDTGRYLIMTVPMLMLLVPVGLSLLRHRFQLVFVGLVLLANTATLLAALASSWQPSFPLDDHLTVTENYLQSHGYQYAYASMDTAIPANYLSDNDTTLLPLTCLPSGQVTPSYLFFDRAAFLQLNARLQPTIPFILDGNAFVNSPSVCSQAAIIQQLGQPKQIDILSDGSSVLVYDTAIVQAQLAPKPGLANPGN